MRRSSVGLRAGPVLSPQEEVIMRSNRSSAPPAIRPGFMRRSCTFVTEGSWRKSSFGLGFSSKESKESRGDRNNLALEVRKKAAELSSCEEESSDSKPEGKVSKLVGNLKSWSSSEDVRHSVVGAFNKTVNVMKQKPTMKRVKQSVNNAPPGGTPGRFISREPAIFNHHQNINSTPSHHNKTGRNSQLRNAKERSLGNSRINCVSSTANLNGVGNVSRSRIITSSPSKGSLLKTPQKSSEGRRIPLKVGQVNSIPNMKDSAQRHGWLRHLHDAQSAYEAREGGRKQRNPHTMPEAEDGTPDNIRDVEEVDADTSECVEASTNNDRGGGGGGGKDLADSSSSGLNLNNTSAPSSNQTPSSPELISKKTELLRRKDLKIRQELEEKQSLIADILNIPREDYESVADMAGEVGMANKEPKELVLGAIFQTTKLQETLNEVQTIKDSDIIVAQACPDPANRGAALSHSQKSLDKLLNISGTLAQLLNSLLSLVSERDDERDRMRKELVASRERLHHLHMKKNSLEESNAADINSGLTDINSSSNPTGNTSSSPRQSRPNSYVSVGSSGLEQTEGETTHTDEDCKTEELANPSVAESKSHLDNDKAEGESSLGTATDADGSSSPALQDASSSPLVPPPQLDEGEAT